LKAAAYRYAEGGSQKPRELILYDYIRVFGADAVMGRPLGAGEIRRMTRAALIVDAYQSRTHAENWAEWADNHKQEVAILNEAMELASNGE